MTLQLPHRLIGFLFAALAGASFGAAAEASQSEPRASAARPLVVFAAASLTDSLQKVSDAYTQASAVPVKLSFAASSALAKQIESGARADVFFSADQEWMDYLDQRRLIDPASRRDVLGNRLVLVAPADSKIALKLSAGVALGNALGPTGRLATGDPDSVPAGKYAKAALSALGVWASLESRLVRADNVRVALMYVARGETPLGIVYTTDAIAEPRVRIVDTFGENTHPPIRYPVAWIAPSRPEAKSFVEFLSSAAARAIFTSAGFQVLGDTASSRSEQ